MSEALFLRAARGEDTATAPIWCMRQAGRYLPEYMAIKAKADFWTMCRTPDLAVEVTLQPLRRYGMDAAILFSDIMTPLPSMGVSLRFAPGPEIDDPIQSARQVRELRVPEADEIAPFVNDTLRRLRAESPVPVIGFAGAPLTLAAYLVEGKGSKDFGRFRAFLYEEPRIAHELLEKLTVVTERYLRAQVDAGAEAIQLFDSWAGLLDKETYDRFGFPANTRILHGLSRVPRIYIAVGAQHLLASMGALPIEVLSVDWRVPLAQVRHGLRPGLVLQGNLDPTRLLAPEVEVRRAAREVLRSGRGGPHIFNLGHGILRQTPPDNVAALVDEVRAFARHDQEIG